MLLGVGDMMVAGRYSKEVVAALGVANSCFGPFLMIGLGLTYALGPILAKKIGEKHDPRESLPSILFYSVINGFFLILLMLLFLYFWLPKIGLAPAIEPLFKEYYFIILFSMLPCLVFQCLKEYLQVQKKIWFANILIIFANISNLILNTVLTFGYFGFPEMGIKGLAISTLANRVFIAIALFVYVKVDFSKLKYISKSFLSEAFKLGIPIGVSILMEVSIFSAVTILIGKMDVLNSAAHNIILNIASFSFMVPLAIANTSSTFVALALADKNKNLALRYAKACIVLGTSFMASMAVLFFIFPKYVVGIYTDKLDLLLKACELLVFAAIFQIPDGLQTVLGGILRGMRITKPTMILTIIGYWGIGLPFGYYLGYTKEMYAKGLWIGLAVALTTMSIFLFGLFIHKFKEVEV